MTFGEVDDFGDLEGERTTGFGDLEGERVAGFGEGEDLS